MIVSFTVRTDVYVTDATSRVRLIAGMRVFVAAIAAAFTLSGCAQYAEVKSRRPALEGPPGSGPLADAEKQLARAQTHDRTKPLRALGDCVAALDIASRELHRDPKNAMARRDYNFALSRIFEIIKKAKLADW